jgi:hypothetical protein
VSKGPAGLKGQAGGFGPQGDTAQTITFTARLKGNLDVIGITVPVGYTAADPPPPNVPFATFTDVTVRNTDLRGGVRKIPGAHISVR